VLTYLLVCLPACLPACLAPPPLFQHPDHPQGSAGDHPRPPHPAPLTLQPGATGKPAQRGTPSALRGSLQCCRAAHRCRHYKCAAQAVSRGRHGLCRAEKQGSSCWQGSSLLRTPQQCCSSCDQGQRLGSDGWLCASLALLSTQQAVLSRNMLRSCLVGDKGRCVRYCMWC
jgi:hypothetical protein